MHFIVKNVIKIFVILVICASVSPTGRTYCAADDKRLDEWFEGSWSGDIQTASESRFVGIEITALTNEAENKDKELKYVGPRGCTVKAKHLGSGGKNALRYVITDSNGGFCDNLLQGSLILGKRENDRLSYEVTYTDKNLNPASEKGLLMPNQEF